MHGTFIHFPPRASRSISINVVVVVVVVVVVAVVVVVVLILILLLVVSVVTFCKNSQNTVRYIQGRYRWRIHCTQSVVLKYRTSQYFAVFVVSIVVSIVSIKKVLIKSLSERFRMLSILLVLVLVISCLPTCVGE